MGALLIDIPAILNGADDRRIGRGPADQTLFKFGDQRRLGEAGRRPRLVTGRAELRRGDAVAFGHVGQARLLVVAFLVWVVVALDIGLEEAIEGDGAAAGVEDAVFTGGGARADLDRERAAFGVGHLRSNRALPDEFIEFAVIGQQPGRGRGLEPFTGGADRLVRFLRVLDFARVYAWLLRQVLRPVQLLDLSAGRVDCGL